ncbi:MAG: PQQ-binding-like beta-propeller repeat protein [Planctomycetes bacterium]|nr:PQQ-binding-like beta-propeller repeat protein [Planctomycetota bacterium]
MKHQSHVNSRFALVTAALISLLLSSASLAVSSKITRHASSSDLLKGKIENIVVGSRGTIQLGNAWETPVDDFEDVWSINSIVVSGGTVYVGTSPNGGIYKYSLGKLTKIYPKKSREKPAPKKAKDKAKVKAKKAKENKDANEPNDPNTVQDDDYLSNEHIFAMATDVSGRLLAGISGDKCRLCRFKNNKYEVIFEPNEVKYIFAITIDTGGNIYLGTGPEGKIYKLSPSGKKPQLLYDSQDKNILSLAAGKDGFIYAGSDSRGLVYKINPRTNTATVLYDSDQPEITALLFTEDGYLHAAATSAKIVQAQTKFAAQSPLAGRPETKPSKSAGDTKGGLKLKIANIKGGTSKTSAKKSSPARKPARPGKASYIYKITPDGFVTDIFNEAAVFFCLAEKENKLLVGTGNNAQLFTVDPASEQQTIIYEDKQASQITAVNVRKDFVYLGTANPAKLIKLSSSFASEGTYTSDLIDAGQPATWGKLQIEADIPQGCKVSVASRSGNVKDINDPTFSSWTSLAEVTQPVQLRCPLGRFCQYKLVLQSKNGSQTPIIREIAVASTVPNLAPKIESVSVSRIATTSKKGEFKISYKAKDDNGDKLIYKIDFRKIGRTNWIELKDELEADNFQWDGKTVEDGRYEVRVTTSDGRSNTTKTKLTGTRISEPVIVDNTAPVIKRHSVEKDKKTITLKLQVSDKFSAIGRLNYTVDSNAKWKGTMPDDLVYDTTDEDFTIVIDKLDPGEHIIAVKITDSLGNITYKTFEVNVS